MHNILHESDHLPVAICTSSLVKQIKKCLKAGLELILKH